MKKQELLYSVSVAPFATLSMVSILFHNFRDKPVYSVILAAFMMLGILLYFVANSVRVKKAGDDIPPALTVGIVSAVIFTALQPLMLTGFCFNITIWIFLAYTLAVFICFIFLAFGKNKNSSKTLVFRVWLRHHLVCCMIMMGFVDLLNSLY